MHLLVYDATWEGPWYQPLLTSSWKAGGALYKSHPHAVDESFGATSWEEALAWLCSVRPGEPIDSVQYWGHGFYGRVYVGRDILDVDALAAGHARHNDLLALRQRMRGESSLFWFRTCSTFATPRGIAFARAWTRFFGCRAAGHTFVIGPLQSGLHSLGPSDEPTWAPTEGVSAEVRKKRRTALVPEDVGADKYGAERVALGSRPWSPNTITCLHGAIPDGW